MAETELETREGLPEALRVLLKDYPREAWETDPAFSDLIRFWLDRHVMFRRLIEDAHYFPRLKALDDRVGAGFDILDRDHHAIDGHLAGFVEDANAVLQALAEGAAHKDALAAYRTGVIRLGGFLDRHLTDEEELVVPVLLKYAPSGLV